MTWDACLDTGLAPMTPGDRTSVVLGVDASVSGDCFAVVGVTRHPLRHDEPAIRFCKSWDPRRSGGKIDFNAIERWILCVSEGGCAEWHPKGSPDKDCAACGSGERFAGLNVVCVVYDPYQMESMAQRLGSSIWMSKFDQGPDRAIADSQFHKYALSGRLSHNGDANLREHVLNARAKLQRDEDSKLRMVKKAPDRKIDLAVAASMAVHQAMYLNI